MRRGTRSFYGFNSLGICAIDLLQKSSIRLLRTPIYTDESSVSICVHLWFNYHKIDLCNRLNIVLRLVIF